MRLGIIATISAMALSVSSAFAAPLGGGLQGLDGRFNDAAATLGMAQRIALRRCEGHTPSVCIFAAGQGTTLMALSQRDGSGLDLVLATFEGADAHENLAAVLLVTMMMFAPSSSEVERWIAVRELARDLDPGTSNVTSLEGISYRLAALRGQKYRLAITR